MANSWQASLKITALIKNSVPAVARVKPHTNSVNPDSIHKPSPEVSVKSTSVFISAGCRVCFFGFFEKLVIPELLRRK